MVKVKHVLKNGTVLDDIAGHVVKKSDCPAVYAIAERKRNEKSRNHGNDINDLVCNLSNGN